MEYCDRGLDFADAKNGTRYKMQNHLIFTIGLGVLTIFPAKASMNTPAIQVSASCRDNASCIFDNREIIVDVTITNASHKAVGMPVEFIDKKGPTCVLKDNETGKELVLQVGLPKRSLMQQFTQIPAGGSITTERSISAGEISQLRPRMTDLTAEFSIGAPFKLEGASKPVYPEIGAALRIIGRDKAELEQK